LKKQNANIQNDSNQLNLKYQEIIQSEENLKQTI